MRRIHGSFVLLGLILLAAPAHATLVSVDLSGAVTGTFIDAVGADFAGTFQGQTIVFGTGIAGSPTNPLTLAPANTLDVAFWNPGVSPASNSILPEPGNQGPLSVLLDSNADSVTWTMGFANPPSSVTIDFFSGSGALVGSVIQALNVGYNVYSFSGVGTFRGFTIFDNNDSAGLRFQNFEYNAVATGVPEPGITLCLGLGLAGIALRRRRLS